MWKEIQASEVYHCYQLIHSCGDRIKGTKSVIPSVIFAFRDTKDDTTWELKILS